MSSRLRTDLPLRVDRTRRNARVDRLRTRCLGTSCSPDVSHDVYGIRIDDSRRFLKQKDSLPTPSEHHIGEIPLCPNVWFRAQSFGIL
jgi:hypothetical protein